MNTRHDAPQSEPEARVARQKALFLYWNALELGDIETCEQILRLAMRDAQLERLIVAAHEADNATQVLEASARDAAQVRELAARFFSEPPSPGSQADEEAELPPLTVAEVAARMQADAAQRAHAPTPQESDLLRRLSRLSAPIPDNLSPRGVRRFLQGLGVACGERAQQAFRETTIFLQMGRQQNVAHLAATRRAQQSQSLKEAAAPQAPQALEDAARDESEAREPGEEAP